MSPGVSLFERKVFCVTEHKICKQIPWWKTWHTSTHSITKKSYAGTQHESRLYCVNTRHIMAAQNENRNILLFVTKRLKIQK